MSPIVHKTSILLYVSLHVAIQSSHSLSRAPCTAMTAGYAAKIEGTTISQVRNSCELCNFFRQDPAFQAARNVVVRR